jgi:hypothetical protein
MFLEEGEDAALLLEMRARSQQHDGSPRGVIAQVPGKLKQRRNPGRALGPRCGCGHDRDAVIV